MATPIHIPIVFIEVSQIYKNRLSFTLHTTGVPSTSQHFLIEAERSA